jgi:acyl carrier protein
MTDWATFSKTLAAYTKAGQVSQDDVLFGSGLNLSSIGFTEFIMTLEEEQGIDVDVDQLDASIRTAGQLYARIFPTAA